MKEDGVTQVARPSMLPFLDFTNTREQKAGGPGRTPINPRLYYSIKQLPENRAAITTNVPTSVLRP